ncbi:MAG: iron uptake porin [Gemmatimonadaceae bacterium]|nr:iron uptake porin [Gloeobacterales cyanobacterium ES-bin-141]
MRNWLIGVVVLAFLAPVPGSAAPDSEQTEVFTEGSFRGEMVRLNSVTELTDVDPNSWASLALASVAGHLNLTGSHAVVGDRFLSRTEFASGLDAALQKVSELASSKGGERITAADLATLERLRSEFATELSVMRRRTDVLESRAQDTESMLFSTMAKLDGSVVMALTGAGSGGRIASGFPDIAPAFGDALGATNFPAAAVNTTLVTRTTLNLRATLMGEDQLLVRLRGVSGFDAGAALPGISSGLGPLFYAGGPNGSSYDQSTTAVSTTGLASVAFDEVYYTTGMDGDRFRALIAARVNIGELVDTNSFANNEELDFSNGLFLNNQLITFSFSAFYGPGAGFGWQLNDFLRLRAIYTSGNGGAGAGNASSNANAFGAPFGAFGAGGLFGGQTLLATELRIDPDRNASIKLQYAQVVEQSAVLGTILPSTINNSVTNGYGVNAEWAITPSLAVFGRYGFAATNVNSLGVAAFSEIHSTTWQAGLTLPDFLGPGNSLGVGYAQPVRVHSGSVSGLVEPGRTNGLVPSGVEGDIELFYRIQLNDRLTITPDLQFIIQPVNSVNSNGLTIGTLRAVFSF